MVNFPVPKKPVVKIKPYLEKSIACPVCRKNSTQPEVKNRLFVERDRDVDLKPKTYLWAIKDLEECHPPLYYMWSCEHCKFTTASVHFANPAKSHNLLNSAFNQGIKFSAERKNYGTISELLQAPALSELPRTFVGGFALHMLALYQLEGMEEIVQRETILLGKYYLRTAWLFRDLKDTFSKEKDSVEQLLGHVKRFWEEIPTLEYACLERAAGLLEKGLETSSAIETTRDEIELILLIARIWMKAGDTRKAKNFGAYSRERLAKYETELAKAETAKTPEQAGEVQRLKLSQSAVLNMLADLST